MSFLFNEASRRMNLSAGLSIYGGVGGPAANFLNLPAAAQIGRLFVDLWVSSASFTKTEDELADLILVSDLTALSGLAVHQGAGYASLPINDVTPSTDAASNKIGLVPDPVPYQWLSLATAASGYALEAIGVRYSASAFATPNGNDLMVYWYNGAGIEGTTMVVGSPQDVNVSLPFLDGIRSIGD